MSTDRTSDRNVEISLVLVAAIVYCVVALLSLNLAYVQANTSAVWPVSGLAIGFLLVLGTRYWTAVALGAFAANLVTNLGLAPLVPSIAASAGVTTGNVLESILGSELIRRYAYGRNFLDRSSSVLGFVVFGALVPALVSALCGVTSLALAGFADWQAYGTIFVTWYTGNVAGILIFAPLVVVIALPSKSRWARGSLAEGMILFLLFVVVGQTISGFFFADFFGRWPNAYMVIPLLLWAAFRFGHEGILAGLLILTAIAVAGSFRGYAVFAGDTPNESLLYLQTFLGIVAIMSLVVVGVISELRAANRSLERKVADRTERLAELVDEKDDLMTIAAHELKAPLAGLRNLLSLIRSHPETLSAADGSQIVGEMEDTSDGMLRLVTGLLEAKKAENLDTSLTCATFELRDVLDHVVSVHSPNAEKRGISVAIEAPATLEVHTHRESFEQISGNLLSNAIKFSPDGSTVNVRLAAEGTTANLEIRDEGPGIPREAMESIFGKFHRLRTSGGSELGSHGIGLYIVKKLADKLHATIECQSKPGRGTAFVVRFPGVPEA